MDKFQHGKIQMNSDLEVYDCAISFLPSIIRNKSTFLTLKEINQIIQGFRLTKCEKRFLSSFPELICVLCVMRSFRQAVLTFVSVMTSSG